MLRCSAAAAAGTCGRRHPCCACLRVSGKDGLRRAMLPLSPGALPALRAVNGNPTAVDFQGLKWVIIIGANGTLELRDMIIYNYALRGAATNTSRYYVGGLVSWPSISAQPGSVLKACALAPGGGGARPAAAPPPPPPEPVRPPCVLQAPAPRRVRPAPATRPARLPGLPDQAPRARRAGTTPRSTSGRPRATAARTASGSTRPRCPGRSTRCAGAMPRWYLPRWACGRSPAARCRVLPSAWRPAWHDALQVRAQPRARRPRRALPQGAGGKARRARRAPGLSARGRRAGGEQAQPAGQRHE